MANTRCCWCRRLWLHHQPPLALPPPLHMPSLARSCSSARLALPLGLQGDSRRRLLGVESFESRYYRGLEVLDRSNATSEEECNARCVNFTQCEYWAWCPTSQEEG